MSVIMNEYKYWEKYIEWLLENKKIFVIHDRHLSDIEREEPGWVKKIEQSKYNTEIKTHNIKIDGRFPDFIYLKEIHFSNSYYVYAIEIKGDVNFIELSNGASQAEFYKNGSHFSTLLFPSDIPEKDFQRLRNEAKCKGIILGKIDLNKEKSVKDCVQLFDEEYARSNFHPEILKNIYDFLILIKNNQFAEPITKIKSNRTIFLHYIIPGLIKYLYFKYENKTILIGPQIYDKLIDHWSQLDGNSSWKENDRKHFYKIGEKFGFLQDNATFFYNLIELYLDSIKLSDETINKVIKIDKPKISEKIMKFYQCAHDSKGEGNYLFHQHELLAHIILQQLYRRYDFSEFCTYLIEIKQKEKNSPFDFRDIVSYIGKINFQIMIEFFCKKKMGAKRITKDKCLKCSEHVSCYGKEIKDPEDYENILTNYLEKVVSASDFDDLPEDFFENKNNTHNKYLRYGVIKSIADSSITYNFKRNLLHLDFFPREFVDSGKIKGNNTQIANYCPKKDLWDIDEIKYDTFKAKN